MGPKTDSLFGITGRLTLFMGAVFMLLFLANLRARLYYQGPDLSSLLWMFFYCGFTGIGLLRLKKWAVLSLFLPGFFSILIFAYGWTKGASAPMPWAALNYAFVIALVAIPLVMLRSWRELHW